MANSLELLLVEQILTNLTNLKLKFDVVAKPTISDNEDFFQRDVQCRCLGTILLLLEH